MDSALRGRVAAPTFGNLRAVILPSLASRRLENFGPAYLRLQAVALTSPLSSFRAHSSWMLRATFQMPSFVSTTELVREAKRIEGAKAFFALFPSAWESVEREVRKLELRQEYQEPGNPSWELLAKGDFKGAMQTISASRQQDVSLYTSLSARNIRFLRLRPVVFPLTTYLQWELGSYAFNAEYGELIYFVDRTAAEPLLEFAHHDFLLFDERLALIHDYDASGLIQGGWELTSREGVLKLHELYQSLLERAEPYRDFLAHHGT
jgi:uncharacterized protein DUF6879